MDESIQLKAHIKALHAAIDDLLEGELIDSCNRDINGILAPLGGTNDEYWSKVGNRLASIKREGEHLV